MAVGFIWHLDCLCEAQVGCGHRYKESEEGTGAKGNDLA